MIRVKWSEELLALMETLTPKQRAAVPRIAAQRSTGESLRSLLTGAGKICTWTTYYRKPRGWHHQERFQRAVDLAEKEYRKALLDHGVDEAVAGMRRLVFVAVEGLADEVHAGRRYARGLEKDELGMAERGLMLLTETGAKEGVRLQALTQLARIAGDQRNRSLRAYFGVLDRADIKTAIKGADRGDEELMELLDELRGAGPHGEELAGVVAEAGDLSETGLRSARGTGASAPEHGADRDGGGGGASGQEPMAG